MDPTPSINDVIGIKYSYGIRIGKVSAYVTTHRGFRRIQVEFFDNGELRLYEPDDERIFIPDPVQIVKWKKDLNEEI